MAAEPSILLVEDNPYDVLLLQRSFRRAGVTASLRTVRDGEQAIAWLEGTGAYADRVAYPLPSLVLLDLKLPKRSGFEVLQWVRSRPLLKRLPMIVLTTSGEKQDLQRAYDLGANSYLVKPASAEQMEQLSMSLADYWLKMNRTASLQGG